MYDIIELEIDNEYEVVCVSDDNILLQINNQAQAINSASIQNECQRQ